MLSIRSAARGVGGLFSFDVRDLWTQITPKVDAPLHVVSVEKH